jgi:hypothetical protein
MTGNIPDKEELLFVRLLRLEVVGLVVGLDMVSVVVDGLDWELQTFDDRIYEEVRTPHLSFEKEIEEIRIRKLAFGMLIVMFVFCVDLLECS